MKSLNKHTSNCYEDTLTFHQCKKMQHSSLRISFFPNNHHSVCWTCTVQLACSFKTTGYSLLVPVRFLLEGRTGTIVQRTMLAQSGSVARLTTEKQCPSWPTGREVMTTSSGRVRGYISTPSPTVQSTPVKRTVERDSAVSSY